MRGTSPASSGSHQVRVEFSYDGGGIGKGGTVTLYIDGSEAGSGTVDTTEGIAFGYEYMDVGRDGQSPVTDDYGPGDNAFTGTIDWIDMEVGSDSHDHLIGPATLVQVAMAKQ